MFIWLDHKQTHNPNTNTKARNTLSILVPFKIEFHSFHELLHVDCSSNGQFDTNTSIEGLVCSLEGGMYVALARS
jgi:hypothetical protein